MPTTPEELELVKKAADMAHQILPELKREEAILSARIKWHEDNINAWKTISTDTKDDEYKGYTVKGVLFKSPRAARGEAQDRILAIMEKHPEYKAKDIQKELERQNGLVYGMSTIYRVMEVVENASQEKLMKEYEEFEDKS